MHFDKIEIRIDFICCCALSRIIKAKEKKTSNTTNTHGLLYNFRMLLSVQHPSLDVILFLFFFLYFNI